MLVERVSRPQPQPTAKHPALDELTSCEREVLELLARGLTNAEIAETLQLSCTPSDPERAERACCLHCSRRIDPSCISASP